MLSKNQQKYDGTKSPPRSRGVMYVQQLDKIKFENINALKKRIQSLSNLKRFAFIIHDKDINKDNKPIAPHVHVMLEFKSPRMLTAVAKDLNDKTEYFESMTKHNKNGINNGFAYLTHRTENASEKYQYDPSQVIANFDYQEFLDEMDVEIIKNRYAGKIGIDNLLSDFINGKLSKTESKEIAKKNNPSLFSQICKKIDESEIQMEELESEKWIQEMRKKHESKNVIWIYGPSGVGKTTLAKMIAESINKNYFTTGSSRDYFQNYHGEHCVLIDELRPNIIEYNDLLRMLSPYDYDCNVPSRYHDHRLTANTIIITSPFSPGEYYIHQRGLNTKIDTFQQLHRRLKCVINVEALKIKLMELISDYQPGEYNGEQYYAPISPRYEAKREITNYIMIAIESGDFQEKYETNSKCILSELKKLIIDNDATKEKIQYSKHSNINTILDLF